MITGGNALLMAPPCEATVRDNDHLETKISRHPDSGHAAVRVNRRSEGAQREETDDLCSKSF
jgi:hypothetical protein